MSQFFQVCLTDFFSLPPNDKTILEPVKPWKKSIPLLFSARVPWSWTAIHLRVCLCHNQCSPKTWSACTTLIPMTATCVIDFDHEDLAVCFCGMAGMQKNLYVSFYMNAWCHSCQIGSALAFLHIFNICIVIWDTEVIIYLHLTSKLITQLILKSILSLTAVVPPRTLN